MKFSPLSLGCIAMTIANAMTASTPDTVVLLHGLGASAAFWRPVVDELGDAHCLVGRDEMTTLARATRRCDTSTASRSTC